MIWSVDGIYDSQDVRETRLSGAARPRPPAPGIQAHDRRRGQRLLPRRLHRGDVRTRHRASYRGRAARKRCRSRASAHARARRRLSAVAAMPQAHRRAVRGRQGLEALLIGWALNLKRLAKVSALARNPYETRRDAATWRTAALHRVRGPQAVEEIIRPRGLPSRTGQRCRRGGILDRRDVPP
jgi:hypothetical protein